jgi:iron complex transport system permease protein
MASDESIVVLVGAAVLLVPAGLVLSRRLTVLELGDDTARALGAAVQRDRAFVLLCAVVLVAVATAAAGPIAFVAMLAGPISGILTATAGRSIAAAALTGAVIVQSADLIAQYALPWPISTGIVTGLVGAPYIAWLLVSANRKGVGG